MIHYLENFLTPKDNLKLLEYAISNEATFTGATVTTGNTSYRRSKVLFSFLFQELLVDLVEAALPSVVEHLKLEKFKPSKIEAQLTAHGHGDYFKRHKDTGSPETVNRIITFVYYFYRLPKSFSGGELLIYGDRADDHDLITPINNTCLFFPSHTWHEVKLVECPSRSFADGRFTVNGWFRT